MAVSTPSQIWDTDSGRKLQVEVRGRAQRSDRPIVRTESGVIASGWCVIDVESNRVLAGPYHRHGQASTAMGALWDDPEFPVPEPDRKEVLLNQNPAGGGR